MIAPNENGRPTEAGTPVADQRVSADAVARNVTPARTTWEVTMIRDERDFDALLDRLRAEDAAATAEPLVCPCNNELFPCVDCRAEIDAALGRLRAGYFVDSDNEPRDMEDDVC